MDEVVAAASALIAAGVDAVFTPTDNVIMAAEMAIAEDFAINGIPHYTGADSFVRNGAYATCGVNYTDLGTRTADLALKAASYEMPSWSVDGMDVEAVESATTRAVDSIRAGGGPHFLELRTYRFRAHSMYDPDRYREKAEIERWKERDPITHLVDVLRAADGLDDAGLAAMEAAVATEVGAAVDAARAGTLEAVDDLHRFVHSPSTAAGEAATR